MAFVVHFSPTKTALKVLCSSKIEPNQTVAGGGGGKEARPLKCVSRAAFKALRAGSVRSDTTDVYTVFIHAGPHDCQIMIPYCVIIIITTAKGVSILVLFVSPISLTRYLKTYMAYECDIW